MTTTITTTATPTAADLLPATTVNRASRSTDGAGVSSTQRLGDAYVTRWYHSDTGTRSVEFSLNSIDTRSRVSAYYLDKTRRVSVSVEQRRETDEGAIVSEATAFLSVAEARELHRYLTSALAAADGADEFIHLSDGALR